MFGVKLWFNKLEVSCMGTNKFNLVLSMVLFLSFSLEALALHGRIKFAKGKPYRIRDGKKTILKKGSDVRDGDQVFLDSNKDLLIVKFGENYRSTMKVTQTTKLTFEKQKSGSRKESINMQVGSLLVDYLDSKKTKLEVATPTAALAVRGTEYQITVLNDRARTTVATVFEGLVSFSNKRTQKAVLLSKDFSSIARGNGLTTPRKLPIRKFINRGKDPSVEIVEPKAEDVKQFINAVQEFAPPNVSSVLNSRLKSISKNEGNQQTDGSEGKGGQVPVPGGSQQAGELAKAILNGETKFDPNAPDTKVLLNLIDNGAVLIDSKTGALSVDPERGSSVLNQLGSDANKLSKETQGVLGGKPISLGSSPEAARVQNSLQQSAAKSVQANSPNVIQGKPVTNSGPNTNVRVDVSGGAVNTQVKIAPQAQTTFNPDNVKQSSVRGNQGTIRVNTSGSAANSGSVKVDAGKAATKVDIVKQPSTQQNQSGGAADKARREQIKANRKKQLDVKGKLPKPPGPPPPPPPPPPT